MVQYEISFPNEYTEEIICDAAKILQMDFVKEDMEQAIDERNQKSSDNVYLLKGRGSFICVDCSHRDWLFGMSVVCRESEAERVKTVMLRWERACA